MQHQGLVLFGQTPSGVAPSPRRCRLFRGCCRTLFQCVRDRTASLCPQARGYGAPGKADSGVAGAWNESYLSLMTTQEKTNAIQKIVTNHKDNVTAAQAANISAGLNALVIEAMNDAFKADLAVVFALGSSGIRSAGTR
jgi:hypothetical protein